MTLDFKILDVTVLEGVFKHRGQPVYQVSVLSHHTQNTYLFDDRYGSWMTTRTDASGNHKEPISDLAVAMQSAVDSAIRRRELIADTAPNEPEPAPAHLVQNPFMSIDAPPAPNPFLDI